MLYLLKLESLSWRCKRFWFVRYLAKYSEEG